LWTIYSEAEFIEISVQVKVTQSRISGTFPRLYLVIHRMKRLIVEPLVTLHLGSVISLGYRSISFPPRGGEQQLIRLSHMVDKDGLK